MAAGRKIEVEMKYEVASPGAADRYLVAPEIGPFVPDGPVDSVRVEDRYIDSADWALTRAGFAARLRKTARGIEIGLKSQNASRGRLQRREEIEGPADASLVPADWPASAARNVVMELCGDEPLVELLTIRQLRRVRMLRSGATRAELSLDEVAVVSGGQQLDTFEELEVELKRGGEAPLAGLVELFDSDDVLTPVSRSKLDRSVAALRAALPTMPPDLRQRWLTAPPSFLAGKPAEPESSESASGASLAVEVDADAAGGDAAGTEAPQVEAQGGEAVAESADDEPVTQHGAEPVEKLPSRPKTGPRTIGVVAEDSMPEAAVKVLRFHFAKMQRREAGTRNGADAEELHDMRVSTRRMRAAWRVFDGAFKAGKTKKIRRRLETLADRLGVVRDLDVLIEGLAAYRIGLDEEQGPGLEPLHSLWRRQRANARNQLIVELDSPGYASFVREMEEFLEDGANAAAAVATPTAPHRVRDRAASEIWAAYEAVRAYELVLPWADVETLHELRIATKWLRYAIEFFGETLGPDGVRLLDRVVALQDHLGLLHDADVATKLARDLLVARAGELSKVEADAIGSYLHSREREVERRRRGLGPIWRAVDGAPFRRALGRATAAL
jgi:CHAD domain-containing protein